MYALPMKLNTFMKETADKETIRQEIQVVAEALTRVGREISIFLNGFVAVCCEGIESFKKSFLPSTEKGATELYQDAYRLVTGKFMEPKGAGTPYPWREVYEQEVDSKQVSRLNAFFEIHYKRFCTVSTVSIIFISFSFHFPIH